MSELDRFDAAKPSQLSTGTVHKRPELQVTGGLNV